MNNTHDVKVINRMEAYGSLGSLDVFVRVSESRSFTAAGQQLGISASAVSKTIARLEERLSVRLFHRSTRTVNLTPEGALFLERCRRILSEVKDAEAELLQTRGTPRVSCASVSRRWARFSCQNWGLQAPLS